MGKAILLAALAAVALAVPAASRQIESDALSGRQRVLQQSGSDVHPWGTLLANSFFFYEAQQSGVLPSWNRARRDNGGWRDNAHTTDGLDSNIDARGGFYDAGDHVKFALPFSAAFSMIGLGALMHEDGYRVSGQWDPMARNYGWAADYVWRTMDPDGNGTVTQVGDTNADHAYWGRPEQQTGARPLKKEKTADTLGNGASILVAASMILGKPGAWQNKTLSVAYLARARRLLAVADANQKTYSDSAGAYVSSGFVDEVAQGYLMLCWADLGSAQVGNTPASCKTALTKYSTAANTMATAYNYDWDNQFLGATALLQLLRPTLLNVLNNNTVPTPIKVATDYLSRYTKQWTDKTKTCPNYKIDSNDFTLCYTKGGMLFMMKWGTLRHVMNIAFGQTLHAKALAANGSYAAARTSMCWARSQLLYAAGSNPSNQSYIVGYTPAGTLAADRPHHRSSSCSPDYSVTCEYSALNAPGPSPSVLKGALVGGPDSLDNFNNVRSDYIQNEVALDYNAGFSGTLAGIHLATSQLSQAGCNWNDYCSGRCDSAITGGSQVVVPSPSPPPSPYYPPPPVPDPNAPPVFPPFVAFSDVHPWSDLLGQSFLFYEAQQSGRLPTWNRVRRTEPNGWRDDAHINDGLAQGVDVTGGFYDAGDHVRYHLPFGQAFSTLAIGALAHEEGYRAAGEWDNMARNLKYGADYIMKVQSPDDDQMYSQVGDTGADHSYWGRPEQQSGTRPLKAEIVADVAGNAAAVLAGVAMILRKSGSLYSLSDANTFLDRAKKLLPLADANPKTFSDSAYQSSGYADEVALGYLMVCWADLTAPDYSNGLPSSCSTAFPRFTASHAKQATSINWDWDNAHFAVTAVMQLLRKPLAAASNGNAPAQVGTAVDYVNKTLTQWQDTSKACPTTAFDGNYQVCYSAGGLPYLTKWGSLRHAMNAGFAATLQAKAAADKGDYASARVNWCWTRGLFMYAAGGNPAQQSYIVGYTPDGIAAADQPHHRSASCNPDFSTRCDWNDYSANSANPSVLNGALVGGPDNTDKFDDKRSNYVQNEVALDYNSGFTGSLAGLSWATNKLSAARCTWDSYCKGTCDQAVA